MVLRSGRVNCESKFGKACLNDWIVRSFVMVEKNLVNHQETSKSFATIV